MVEYLGHNVSATGTTPHEAKIAAIRDLKPPSSVPHLRSILGLLNYYRCYIPNFSAKAAPLNALLKKDAPWVWGTDQAQAFEALIDEMCAPGSIIHPHHGSQTPAVAHPYP